LTHLDTVNREGEYAVVTGGNRGIGWHTVKGLVDAGMKVIVGTIIEVDYCCMFLN